jgi:DNA-binding NtrC family response regulator
MRILIVDDEKVQREILADFLKEHGFDTVTASNGTEALEEFKRSYFTLVLLDHRMPDINGDELLRQMKAINPMIHAIMITAYGSVDTAVQVMKLGADDFLEKPVDLKELLEKVEAIAHTAEVEQEVDEVLEEIEDAELPFTFVAQSPAMREIISIARRVAPTPWPVLIYGETGTGKEIMARLIHELSDRAGMPFIEVNCAAIPENLFESELFGHKKGAFTGATSSRKGLFELAENGTIFLDEIGEMPEQLQPKLLRTLQEGTITPVGAERPIKVDARVVAATNRNIKEIIREGRFREDLYYRLNVFEIELPPLRSRREDIPALIELFMKKYSSRPISIAPEALDMLVKYDWPGNVRELEHTIQRLTTLTRGRLITKRDLSPAIRSAPSHELGLQLPEGAGLDEKIEALERSEIVRALKEHGWVQTRAAKSLGLSERVLRYKMKKYDIKRQE